MVLLLLLLFCRYRIFFFLAFANKQNFKRLRDTHLSGRKRHGQPRLHFLGLLVSLEGGLSADYFTLIGNVGSFWHFIGVPCGLLEDSEVKPILPVKSFPFAVCLFVFHLFLLQV